MITFFRFKVERPGKEEYIWSISLRGAQQVAVHKSLNMYPISQVHKYDIRAEANGVVLTSYGDTLEECLSNRTPSMDGLDSIEMDELIELEFRRQQALAVQAANRDFELLKKLNWQVRMLYG